MTTFSNYDAKFNKQIREFFTYCFNNIANENKKRLLEMAKTREFFTYCFNNIANENKKRLLEMAKKRI